MKKENNKLRLLEYPGVFLMQKCVEIYINLTVRSYAIKMGVILLEQIRKEEKNEKIKLMH